MTWDFPISPHFEISDADDGRFILETHVDKDHDGDPLLTSEEMVELKELIELALSRRARN